MEEASWKLLFWGTGGYEDGLPVYLLRILFGVLFSIHSYLQLDCDNMFDAPSFFLPHPALGEFVTPGEHYIDIHYTLMVLGLLISAGLLYRLAVAIALVLFTQVVFADAGSFFNHWYLQWLLLLLFQIIPAHNGLSIDAAIKKRRFSRISQKDSSSNSNSEFGEQRNISDTDTFLGMACPQIPCWCRRILCFQVKQAFQFKSALELRGNSSQNDDVFTLCSCVVYLMCRCSLGELHVLLGRHCQMPCGLDQG
jgi:hypothetical protein